MSTENQHKNHIKSLLMRAAGGDLSAAEQQELQALLENDDHLDTLARLQREQTAYKQAFNQEAEDSSPATLSAEQRSAVLHHAQQGKKKEQNTFVRARQNSKAPKVNWIAIREIAAACLVVTATLGVLGGLLMPAISSAGATATDYKEYDIADLSGAAGEEFPPMRISSVTTPESEFMGNTNKDLPRRRETETKNEKRDEAFQNIETIRRQFHTAYDERSLEEVEVTILNEVITDQPIVTDLDVPVEELATEDSVDRVSAKDSFYGAGSGGQAGRAEGRTGSKKLESLSKSRENIPAKSSSVPAPIKIPKLAMPEAKPEDKNGRQAEADKSNNSVTYIDGDADLGGFDDTTAGAFVLDKEQYRPTWKRDAAKAKTGPGQPILGGQIAEPKLDYQSTDLISDTLSVEQQRKLIELEKQLHEKESKLSNDKGAVYEARAKKPATGLDAFAAAEAQNRRESILELAQSAQDGKDYDKAILYAQEVLTSDPDNQAAATMLASALRERHVYLRGITADQWDEEHLTLTESVNADELPTVLEAENTRRLAQQRADQEALAKVKEQLAQQQLAQQQRSQQLQKQARVNYPVNPWVMSTQDRLSTFAIDTDSASYRMARNYISGGYLPPAGLVRMEEFVNAFDYNYERERYKTFTVQSEAAASPYGEGLSLVKVGIKGKVIGREERKAAHLVIAVDTSGSMAQADRLPLVQAACLSLLNELDADDRITLISYGRQAHLLLENKSLSEKQSIITAINALQCDSSTDLRQGLDLAYKLASRHFRSGAVNRVVLCSDGVANVGETDVNELLTSVKSFKDQGITCTTVGVGSGVYNDVLLERLANNGDGTYLYIDNLAEARRVFSEELAANLQYIAKDVKIQVEFNPERVRRYRLIGYENRQIADTDFRNDSVDAGEVGSGQSATALYEVELVNAATDSLQTVDIGTVFLRWKDVDTNVVSEESHRLRESIFAVRSPSSAPRFYMAAIAAEFAEILRESEHTKNSDLERLIPDIEAVAAVLPLDQQVHELMRLIKNARGLPRGQ